MSVSNQKAVDWSTISRVHFIGVGGIGMSALARLMRHEGKKVSGSDRSTSVVTHGLEADGVVVFTSQSAENISDDIDLVVYTDAMATDHEEMVAAKHTRIPMMSYFEALGAIANRYYLIAVAGTHGKTTTTAMLTDILEEAGLDPTAVVGSLRAKTQKNFRAGKSKYFIVEADEYLRHFLNFTPDMLIITNIEADHLDYYKDLADVQSAFKKLAGKVPESGAVICNPKDPNVAPVVEKLTCRVIDYTPFINPLVPMKVIGMHNYQNAAAASAVADALRVGKEVCENALSNFVGTWRRFEYKGVMPRGTQLYDDYAHHPTEIRATLRAVREHFKSARIVVAFHPHLYSRTKLLFDEFSRAFTDADEVFIAPIFAAREENDGTITHAMLADAIKKNGTPAHACESFEDIIERLRIQDAPHLVAITMGAGDIYKIHEGLIDATSPQT